MYYVYIHQSFKDICQKLIKGSSKYIKISLHFQSYQSRNDETKKNQHYKPTVTY